MHAPFKDPHAVLARYPLGKKVQVYYDPNRPQFACLEKSGMDFIVLLAGYGVYVMIMGLLIHFFL